MKARLLLTGLGLALATACVPRPERTADQPPPQAAPPQPAPVPPPPAGQDWRDIPLTPGTWHYGAEGGGSAARFGAAETEAIFSIRCDRAQRRVVLSLEGVHRGAMTIRTSTLSRSLPMTVQEQPIAYSHAALAASDPFLDAIVFSRGRFTVEAPGSRMLVLPAWAEPARVVEDCRG